MSPMQKSSSNSAIDAVVTFHSEGIVAHRTLLGLERLRLHAQAHAVEVRIVAVLDNATAETREIVCTNRVLREGDQVVEVRHGDLSLSRNAGIEAARAGFVGVFDGDDYYSANWLTKALATAQAHTGEVVVHPEFQVSFGTVHCIARSIDMDETPDYPLANCLTVNPWGACSFGRRETYLAHPYHVVDFRGSGFGHEDWHWNVELVAGGVRHVSAPGTAHFYRRKTSSMLTDQVAGGAVIRPSRFFEASQPWWQAMRKTRHVDDSPVQPS